MPFFGRGRKTTPPTGVGLTNFELMGALMKFNGSILCAYIHTSIKMLTKVFAPIIAKVISMNCIVSGTFNPKKLDNHGKGLKYRIAVSDPRTTKDIVNRIFV